MATIQPPPPPPPPSAPPTTTDATSAQVIKAPPQIAQLKVGEGVEAKLIPAQQSQAGKPATGQAGQGQASPSSAAAQATSHSGQNAPSLPAGQVQVQTPYGPVTLQTHMPLPEGATLTLTLTSLKPPVFQIGSVDGKPVTLTPPTQAQTAQGAQIPNPTPLAEGVRVGATLLRPITVPAAVATPQSGQNIAQTQAPQTATGNPAQSPAPVPAGTAGISGTGTPTTPTGTQPASGPQTPSPITPQQSGTPSTSPGTTTPPTSQGTQAGTVGTQVTLPTGTRLSITVVRISPPQSPLNTQGLPTNTLSVGGTLTGTVTGTTAQGQPIVQTPLATIALGTRAPVQVGAQVLLKVETAPVIPDVPETAKLGRTGPLETLVQSRSWSDMDEALKAVQHADPARFQHVLQNIVPQPGAKLSSQMLFFLTALKGGDIKSWVGDTTVRILERERPGLMARVNGDFHAMSRLADDPQSGDWRLALMPFWNGKELEQLRMYYRGGGGNEGEDGEDEGTRFILDVDLSNLGHMQIDGLVKSERQNLDLIVRSEIPLPEDWRTDIGEVFTIAQELVGLTGGVSFQASADTFVEFPPIDTAPPTPGLFV